MEIDADLINIVQFPFCEPSFPAHRPLYVVVVHVRVVPHRHAHHDARTTTDPAAAASTAAYSSSSSRTGTAVAASSEQQQEAAEKINYGYSIYVVL